MPPSTTARTLAKKARMLGIEGYRSMNLRELRSAVAEADENGSAPKRTKKAPAKARSKAPAKKVARSPRKAVAKRAPAKKAPARATTAAKRTAKTTTPKTTTRRSSRASVDPANPFRAGTNLALMTEELLKGGKRDLMIRRLDKAIEIHPWSKDEEENVEAALSKRLLMTAKILERDHGFTVEREGRGSTGKIQAFPPTKKGRKRS